MTTASLHHLTEHRQQFPPLAHSVYFNYGGQGPMPTGAIAAIHHTHDHSQHLGPFSNRANQWLAQESAKTRGAIAQALGAPSDTISLTENVSVGCNVALWGMAWREGDHLLLTDCEHPGIIAAAEEIRRRFGVKITTCPLLPTLNSGNPVEVLESHLLPTTRLVVLSHILWNTGQVLPLTEIVSMCHAYPSLYGSVPVLVDAAQSVGVLPLNLPETGVDFYAFTGHKWWCGPAGVGGLYVSATARESLYPTFIGWRNITSDEAGNPTGWKQDGMRYEVATSNYALYAGLREAIAIHDQWGTAEQRYQRICSLSQQLWQGIRQIPGVTCLRTQPPEAGLVSFQLPQASNAAHHAFVNALEDQNMLVRTILNPSCIRACVHYLTTEDECDRLIHAIRALLSGH
jgi:L-cysteine/cystine lyase